MSNLRNYATTNIHINDFTWQEIEIQFSYSPNTNSLENMENIIGKQFPGDGRSFYHFSLLYWNWRVTDWFQYIKDMKSDHKGEKLTYFLPTSSFVSFNCFPQRLILWHVCSKQGKFARQRLRKSRHIWKNSCYLSSKIASILNKMQ